MRNLAQLAAIESHHPEVRTAAIIREKCHLLAAGRDRGRLDVSGLPRHLKTTLDVLGCGGHAGCRVSILTSHRSDIMMSS